MLDLKLIRENPEVVRRAIEVKHVDLNLDELLEADRYSLDLEKKIMALNTESNANAKKFGKATPEEREALKERGRDINAEITALTPQLQEARDRLAALMLEVPNIPAEFAPIGESEDDNVVIKSWGEPRHFDFPPLDHVQILENHKWADFQRIAAVSGSRSYSLRNEAVLLEFALLRFALEKMMAKGFTLASVPSMAREYTFMGQGMFPKARDQVYSVPEDDIYLAGTSEVALNSLHKDEILSESELPILYGGFSACFRREAGSSGRDVRGLIRVHQFNKVEQYVLCKNDSEESAAWHQKLLNTSEEILQALELPYQVVECCTGDMGLGKFRMNDINSWVPSEGKYRETHSCSSLHDWQARRTNLRYRGEDGKVRFAHTLNNTALATPRIMVPFLENHQQADGSISLPAALQPYMGGLQKLG
ncbi:serine--tRNA ligase [Candidatus Chlorohelix sp.]|uniref:serine--tRNA ligase n=1 Tax=Candidatus Chlorohelix sp. TaxID=3139201 RepID=UPI0030365192